MGNKYYFLINRLNVNVINIAISELEILMLCSNDCKWLKRVVFVEFSKVK